jgi:hypothetical protein
MVFWDTYGPFFKNGRKGALFQFCSALFAKIGVFVIELGAFRAANLNRGLAERVDAFGRTGRGGIPQTIAARDETGLRWSYDPDGCCAIRKVEPLARAKQGLDSWISGRKAFQSQTRAALPRFEIEDGRLKVNPLGDWNKADLEAYFTEHDLPRHPLEAQGYLSIGCAPCTSIVKPGEDPRAGRWRGWDKTECGIHGRGHAHPRRSRERTRFLEASF